MKLLRLCQRRVVAAGGPVHDEIRVGSDKSALRENLPQFRFVLFGNIAR